MNKILIIFTLLRSRQSKVTRLTFIWLFRFIIPVQSKFVSLARKHKDERRTGAGQLTAALVVCRTLLDFLESSCKATILEYELQALHHKFVCLFAG